LLNRIWLLLALPLCIWLIGWHRASAGLIIVALLSGAGLMALHQRALSTSVVAPFIDKKISVKLFASVVSDPKLGEPKQMVGWIKPATTTALISVISVRVKGVTYKAHLPLRMTTSLRFTSLPGSVFSASGILYSTPERKVAGLFAERGAITEIHGAGVIGRTTGAIRGDFRTLAIRAGGAAGALIPGLVLGDTSLESKSFTNDMLRAGLTHLTAVSGENFAIIAAFVMWLLQWVIPTLRPRLVICAVVLVGFIFLVRPSPSVLRATVMVSVLLLAQSRGARSSALAALGLAISLLILIDPFEATDPGFALSVAATAGILLLFTSVADFLQSYLRSRKLAELLAISISANIFCAPLVVAISGQFSLISLPSNFLVEPLVAPITIVGFIAALLSPFASGFAYLLTLSAKPFASAIVWVATNCAKVPVIYLSKGFLGGSITLLVLAIGWIALRWRSWGSP
jgi:competence protein ComEC